MNAEQKKQKIIMDFIAMRADFMDKTFKINTLADAIFEDDGGGCSVETLKKAIRDLAKVGYLRCINKKIGLYAVNKDDNGFIDEEI